MTIAYPVHFGLAYVFLVGYLARTLFVCLRLPASVGVLISGFLFSQFFQDDLKNAHGTLQEIAFFCVLFEAGLDLTLRDLQPYIFVLAWLPWTLELLALAGYGMFVLGFTKREGLVLATILSTLGPGLVMPKMKEFGARFNQHPLPRLVFTWAPLEGSMALATFGFLLGVVPSQDDYASSDSIGMLILANGLRIVSTVGAGVLIGFLSGWLISRRMQLRIRERSVFIGVPVETFLMALTAALVAFSLGAKNSNGNYFVPLGFAPGSMFISELLVVAMGTTFAMAADRDVLSDVKGILGGVWVFGQLILFSMIGSGTSLSIVPEIMGILPLIGVGLSARLVGVFVSVFTTRRARGCETQPLWTTVQDACFCFLGTLPRAMMQAALGSLPITDRFFRGASNEKVAETYIDTAAKVYILCMSLVGQTLLNTLGPLLLARTMERPEEEYCKGSHSHGTVAVGTSASTISTAPSSELERLGAIGLLAEEHGVNPDLLRLLLEEAQDDAAEKSDGAEATVPPVPHPERKDGFVLLEDGRSGNRRNSSVASNNTDLVFSQFDSMGSTYTDTGNVSWRPSSTKLRRTHSSFT
mmetsp:Transcript_45041/g.90894  ORF Transcript_45041/g.90894 Transcript_45041/m.90894 type:complete len:584 (-) Transcript_45041:362-2113(-)